ncbi:hypothetical protein HS088_TW23G00909 [Tripterygium wilfordii]|uniref:Uncharacterized protein n=1 Tax=Tripterygium wilfordii TaxID=458696 RepID=A0A7J7BWG3_TRIWF|nr:uncharacterized protein LOC119992996 isoform X2 [Tripterygium wilfordii]KAF5726168.1 hypothetical protein HS088_TW23G00909 [Tripterygium wilfordii]
MNQISYFRPLLRESIDRFLSERRNGERNFCNFTSIFCRLLQSLPDPPLEIVWFYSALTFHSLEFSDQEYSKPVLVVKELFQLIVSCSDSCNVNQKMATLAPVMCELYRLVVFDKKELRGEIEDLLEGIVGYISICCGTHFEEEGELESLSSCFEDLVRVWMVKRVGENCDTGKVMRAFFPLLGDGVLGRVCEGCEVGYLAGTIMTEAFLLRLCLKFGSFTLRTEIEEELRNNVVQMINGFRNVYFFDTILRMLLEPMLPVTSLLSIEDEVFLREVLYDAVIMAEYSFLDLQGGVELPSKHLKSLAVTWLLVADNAIRFAREIGDQTKVISYMDAFCESRLSSQLSKWIIGQTGICGQSSKPTIGTPIALIRWILNVEKQGIKVFDCDTYKIYAESIIRKSRKGYELPAIRSDGENLREDYFLYSENESEEDDKLDDDTNMVDSMDVALSTASGLISSGAIDDTRKRKEERMNDSGREVKFTRYEIQEYSVR